MCTVTFIAQRQGYRLGMNRDEKRARCHGLSPKKMVVDGCTVISPTEPGGGTWIGLNEHGVTLALVNWYAISSRVDHNAVTRGDVVKSARTAAFPECVDAVLDKLPLARINPFRLIGVFPASHQVIEWRWDLKRIVRKKHRWRVKQWISSGFDEPMAQRIRGRTFRSALRQRSTGSLEWLRRLHRSHVPQAGPFSTCMHREDAVTVSYTEITVSSKRAGLRYCAGAPCQHYNYLKSRPLVLELSHLGLEANAFTSKGARRVTNVPLRMMACSDS
jgi:hypothetical protein